MARKVKTPREIVLECCEGSRQASFFDSLSNDAYCGYQTAMVKALNPSIDASAEELYKLITEMVKNKEI